MKKILITGAGSYLGTCLERYLSQWEEAYQVDTADMLGDGWKTMVFSGYDSIFHVAAIVHRAESKENEALYYRVNRDLACEVAEKAKNEGVRQFIFLSSMSVYGIDSGPVPIHAEPNPKSHYGKSKLQAEQAVSALRSDSFAVAILRPPMVYGEGCKGNYQSLVKFAKVMPFFPDYENKRSMLSIENLVSFVKTCIDEGSDGLYCPEDPEHHCTCRMVQQIAADMGRKLPLIKALNPAVSLVKHCTAIGCKAFGDLYYERDTL